jgi:hypothetical protein
MKNISVEIPNYENMVTIYYDSSVEPGDHDYPGAWDCELHKIVDDETFEDITAKLDNDQINYIIDIVADFDQ